MYSVYCVLGYGEVLHTRPFRCCGRSPCLFTCILCPGALQQTAASDVINGCLSVYVHVYVCVWHTCYVHVCVLINFGILTINT